MRSLLFWKKKNPPVEVAQTSGQGVVASATSQPSTAGLPVTPSGGASTTAPASTPAPAVAAAGELETVVLLPLQRLVYALALDDPHAADMHAQADVDHVQLLRIASREFARVGTEPRYTPQRPSLLPQLIEVMSDEEASLRALSRIVAQDPQLTGELLRSANSPLYRVSATPVESIERATSLLGTQGIRALIAARLVQPLTSMGTKDVGRFGERIWEFSMYSASAAEAYAARQGADPFAAHLLALLHGLGAVSVYRVLADLYAGQPTLPPDAAAMAGALEANAALVAARIAANWGLSERTQQALETQASVASAAAASPLAGALRFGLVTGAITLLCKHGQLTLDQAPAQLELSGFGDAASTRVWDRLVKAYIDP